MSQNSRDRGCPKKGNGYFRNLASVFDSFGSEISLGQLIAIQGILSAQSRGGQRHHIVLLLWAFPDHRNKRKESNRLLQGNRTTRSCTSLLVLYDLLEDKCQANFRNNNVTYWSWRLAGTYNHTADIVLVFDKQIDSRGINTDYLAMGRQSEGERRVS